LACTKLHSCLLKAGRRCYTAKMLAGLPDPQGILRMRKTAEIILKTALFFSSCIFYVLLSQ